MNNAIKKQRVLVVDDQPRLMKFVEIKLRLSGYEVLTASCGLEALDLIRSEGVDIVLLDVIMPGMDGYEVLRKLRTFTELPVIVFSAGRSDPSIAMDAGANDYLAKPFHPDEMLVRIKRLI